MSLVSKIKISAVVPALPEPPGSDRVPAPARRFLIPIEQSKTIGDLYSEIYRRYSDQYLGHGGNPDQLFIVKLQDDHKNDLAQDDLVGDIFDNLSQTRHEVTVIRGHLSRWSSIPADSTLRPQHFRAMPAMHSRDAHHEGPYPKRQRLNPVPEESQQLPALLNPDKPIPSTERSLPTSADLGHDSIQQALQSPRSSRSDAHVQNQAPTRCTSPSASSESSSQQQSEADEADSQQSSSASVAPPKEAGASVDSDDESDSSHASDSSSANADSVQSDEPRQQSMNIDSRALQNLASSPPSNQHHARRLASSPVSARKAAPVVQGGFRVPELPSRFGERIQSQEIPQPPSSSRTATTSGPLSQDTPTRPRTDGQQKDLYDNDDIWNVSQSPSRVGDVQNSSLTGVEGPVPPGRLASPLADAGATAGKVSDKPFSRAITKDRAFEGVRAMRRARDADGADSPGSHHTSPVKTPMATSRPLKRGANGTVKLLGAGHVSDPFELSSPEPVHSGERSSNGLRTPQKPPVARILKLGHHACRSQTKNMLADGAVPLGENRLVSTIEKKRPPFAFSGGSGGRHAPGSTTKEAQKSSPMLSSASESLPHVSSSQKTSTPDVTRQGARAKKGAACKACHQNRRKCIFEPDQSRCQACVKAGFACITQEDEKDFKDSQHPPRSKSRTQSIQRHPSSADKGKEHVTNPFAAATAAAAARKERDNFHPGPSQRSPLDRKRNRQQAVPVHHTASNSLKSSRSDDIRDGSQKHDPIRQTPQQRTSVLTREPQSKDTAAVAPSAELSSEAQDTNADYVQDDEEDEEDDDNDEDLEQHTSDEEDKVLQSEIDEVSRRGGSNVRGKVSQLISSMWTPFARSRTPIAGQAWYDVQDAQAAMPSPPLRREDVMEAFTPHKSKG